MAIVSTAVSRRLVALAACSLLVTSTPIPVFAEYGLFAGTAAVNTAGQPVLVRLAPGWDAAVAHEVPAGASVTVWDVAQSAADGSLWYPIDGGYVPAESLTSVATLEAAVQASQGAATLEAEDTWTEPAMAETEGWVDPATGEWVVAAAPASGWVDPAAPGENAAPASSELVQSAATTDGIDPATGEWGEAPVLAAEYVDPAMGAGVEPAAPVEAVDAAAPAEAWVDPAAPAQAADPAVGEWDQSVALTQDAIVEEAIEPTGTYVELEQRGKNRDDDKGKDRDKKDRDGRDGEAGTSSGRQIADFALKFEGYPYVYAGEGPNAFDCSGFTMFVIKKTLGLDITHDMFAQYDMGQEVDRNDLQPGDLVFFKNTYRRGMSHNGIYIGGGQFVHAENESTGVVISDLASDYYGERWYGAVRFGE